MDELTLGFGPPKYAEGLSTPNMESPAASCRRVWMPLLVLERVQGQAGATEQPTLPALCSGGITDLSSSGRLP